MPKVHQPRTEFGVRIDLHCHSSASSEPGEAVLEALGCPESFSAPSEVYDQAKRRRMDFVTITDHDSIAGVETIAARPDVLVGEELTCFFPEDGCKMHVLLWGISRGHHDDLQAVAANLYDVAAYIEKHNLAHAVAHPVYRQNDKLERWHVERLLLLFKGFECLNGSHSVLHREAFEPMLDLLTPQRLADLSARHGLLPRWPEPWNKSRTGGSDDHGLFNIGRTWTEFPAGTATLNQVLDCLREGRCQPGGEAGSSLKLAHNFYGVGIRYLTRRMSKKPTASLPLLQAMVGERPLRRRDVVKGAIRNSIGAIGRRIRRPLSRRAHETSGVESLSRFFQSSLAGRIGSHLTLIDALRSGHAPLAEHQAMWELVQGLVRDTTSGIAGTVGRAVQNGNLGPIFDALSAVALQQFMLMPYYFALFHQNRERHLLSRVTGTGTGPTASSLRVGVFTDAFDQMNGISRFAQTLGDEGQRRGHSLVVHTCTSEPIVDVTYRKNFQPLWSAPSGGLPNLILLIPPLAEILEWADRQQFDAIHVHSQGPMGLCGLAVAAMLRIPVIATYQTDLPAQVFDHTADHRLTVAAESYARWFLSKADRVFARSRRYEQVLHELGVTEQRASVVPPCVDTDTFNPSARDVNYWAGQEVRETRHLVYCGQLTADKNLRVLADTFKRVCKRRKDTALIIAGDGPQQKALREQLAGLPVYFLGHLNDAQLALLFANSDLLLLPSRTDTLGQVVLEAQACGLPVLVSDEGGPREMVDDGITGLILPATDAQAWAAAVNTLLNDEPRRQRMARTAPHRVSRYTVARTFDAFWEAHLSAAEETARRHGQEAVPQHAAQLHARAEHLATAGGIA